MKSKTIGIILSLLIIPQVTFAAWWNPFTWNVFHRTNDKTQILKNTAEVTEIEKLSSTTQETTTPVKVKPVVRNTPVVDKSKVYETKKATSTNDLEVQREIIKKETEEQRQQELLKPPVITTVKTTRVATPPTHIILPPAPKPPITYSDYNFGYQWKSNNGTNVLSCNPTSRNIVIKKVVFKIVDEDLQKLAKLKSFEDDGWKYTLSSLFGVSGRQYTLEKKDENTFQYVGVNIPLTCSDRAAGVSMCGSITEATNQGRNVGVYTTLKGLDTSDGTVCANISLAEWEVFDNTTGKPVKLQ